MIDGIWLKALLLAWAILLGAFAAMTGRDYFVAPILRIVDKCKEMQWPAILFNVAFCTMFISAAIEAGATKTNGVMSLPPQTMTMQHPALEQMQAPVGDRPQMLTSGGLLEQTVSDEGIALGYICVLETNDVAYSYAMPPNAQIIGNWHMRGTFAEWMPVSLGWSFPLGTNSYSMFSVFNNGMIRPRPRDVGHQITAVGVPMLFTQGLSKFWTFDCVDGSKLLCWDNAFLNGDTNTPVNAQITLCQNGNFSTRSNEQLRVYRRVNPADWDGDGLANVIDAAPKTSNGYCFGTGVDWLNANCGGVLSASVDTNGEIVISWNYGVNPDAYYWLTFTSLADNNLISIACDGPSNLGDLTVIANSNQVCQVPLLVGASYHVTAEGPLSEVSALDQNATIEYNDPQQPGSGPALMMFACGQPQEGTTSDFYVDYNLNISFAPNGAGVWALGVMPKNPGVSLDDISGCCCSSEVTTNGFTWTCSDSCTCGTTTHQLLASVSWEGYSKVYWCETQCGCAYDTPPPVPQEGPYAASVSVSFDKGAIIFEDAYENLPGVWVGRRSTSAHLTIHANGGPNGGVLAVSSQNLGKLQKNSGPAFPTTPVAVPAGYSITYEMNYVGLEESDAENDIGVTAIFAEDDSEDAYTNECQLTSVRLALSPVWEAPENPCTNRHMYGVGEKVRIQTHPELTAASVELTPINPSESYYDTLTDTPELIYTCPVYTAAPDITVACKGAEYNPQLTIVEPAEIVCKGASWDTECLLPTVVGGTMLATTNYVGPMTVSFHGIMLAEIPCYDLIPPTGYFDTTYTERKTHSYIFSDGWSMALRVGTNNYWTVDRAGHYAAYPNWAEGRMEWMIPIGWFRLRYEGDSWKHIQIAEKVSSETNSRIMLIGGRMDANMQVFEISGDGTASISKHGHLMSRGRFCRVKLDNNTIQWFHK